MLNMNMNMNMMIYKNTHDYGLLYYDFTVLIVLS